MNLIKRTLLAASMMTAVAVSTAASAMPTPVAYDAVSAQAERMLVLRARMQWLETQMRELESLLYQMQDAQRRGEAPPAAGALDGPSSGPGPQGNYCPRQDGSCGSGGMMQGMMQMMGQMMKAMLQ